MWSVITRDYRNIIGTGKGDHFEDRIYLATVAGVNDRREKRIRFQQKKRYVSIV